MCLSEQMARFTWDRSTAYLGAGAPSIYRLLGTKGVPGWAFAVGTKQFPVVQLPPHQAGKGSDVERISQFGLYELGQALDKLRGFKNDVSPSDAFVPLMTVSRAIGKLRKGEPLPITVSEERARELEMSIDNLIRETFYTTDDEGKRHFRWPEADAKNIPEWRWKSIVELLEKFETVFAEDMRENATYYVPRRGIYFTKALVDAADESFPKEVADHISDKTRSEWRAAGRCLAFNLLSASGFHVARAVESAVEQYYQYFCAKGPDDTLNGWQDYIDALERARGACASNPKTLAELKQMKDDFRNPVVHPRIVLSESNARMLFNNGESLIIAMAQDIADAKKKNPEPQTTLLGLINTVANEQTEETNTLANQKTSS
jgi:hypothetical protein